MRWKDGGLALSAKPVLGDDKIIIEYRFMVDGDNLEGPIRSQSGYDAAAAMLDTLVLRADLTPGERDYLAVLTDLVEAYDRKHFPPTPDRRTPHERLRSLMADAGVSPAELQKILGVAQSTVSMILSGQRGISKAAALALGKRFSLNPAYFL